MLPSDRSLNLYTAYKINPITSNRTTTPRTVNTVGIIPKKLVAPYVILLIIALVLTELELL